MMPRRQKGASEGTNEQLAAILAVLQKTLIMQAANAGMSMGQVRSVVGVNNNRLSKIWRHIKKNSKA